MILGAFTPEVSNNPYDEFATDLVQGNTIILEYFEPKSSDDGVIHISKVIHGYVNTFSKSNGLGNSGNCNNDVICQQWNNWINERRAVIMLLVDNNTAFCSGCLVNNTRQDFTPYILTANHCYFNRNGGQISNPATNIFRFFYWRPNCAAGSNTGTGTPTGWQSITGATLRARHAATDFALLQLNTRPPAIWNVYYAGWDRTTTPTQPLTCIHHPQGDAMKITVDNHAATIVNNYDAGNGPANCWRVVWDSGTTEKGSSGSPLFNVSRRIIGQLYGGTASCNNMSGHDNYGRFDLSWTGGGTDGTRLSNWLAPGLGSNAPQTLNGTTPVISGPTLPITICYGSSQTFSASNWQNGYTWHMTDGDFTFIGSNTSSTVSISPTNSASSGAGVLCIRNSSGTVLAKTNDIIIANFPSLLFNEVVSVTQSQPHNVESPKDYYPDATGYNWSWAMPYPSGQVSLISNFYNSYDAMVSIFYPFMPGSNVYTLFGRVKNKCGISPHPTIIYNFMAFHYSPSPTNSSVYPNPVSDVLNIEIDAEAGAQAKLIEQTITGAKPLKIEPAYDICLYDGQGNLLRQTNTKGGTTQFNVSNLPNGIYYLHVYDGASNKPKIQQIVVER